MTLEQQKKWQFIEENYPNYYSCERVGLSNRIASFIDGSMDEDEEDLARHELTIELNHQGNETLEEFAEEYMDKLNEELYQEALKHSTQGQ